MPRHRPADRVQKGNSDARIFREQEFSESVIVRFRGKKRLRRRPRFARYEAPEDRNKYTGAKLRKLRGERGVGRLWAASHFTDIT